MEGVQYAQAHPVSESNQFDFLQDQAAIKFCEHKEELAVYSSQHNTALCNDCYFENQGNWGKTLTLKQASNENVLQLQKIYEACTNNLSKCSEMQHRILNQESLEEEITKKVDQQFNMLKGIIDE